MFANKHGDASLEWKNWPAYFLFFLMLAFPMLVSLLYVKAFLFALLLLFVAIQGLTGWHLHPAVVLWTLVLAAVSLFFCLRGMVLGTPGAVKCAQVYVFWPLVYLVLLGGIRSTRMLHGLERTLVFSSLFIGVFGAVYLLSQLTILPAIPHSDSFFETDELSSGFYEGYVELAFPGLNSLPFLVPFLIAAVVRGRSRGDGNSLSRLWAFVALLFTLPIVLLSGRRALQFVTMLAPFLTLALGSFQPRAERRLLTRSLRRVTVGLILLVVLSIPLLRPIYAVSFAGLADRFSAGFDFSSSNQSDSADGRRQQYIALKSGWSESPLIGKGLGASATSVVRGSMPWAYELYYLALLFQIGLLGFCAYTAGIVWIYWSGIRIIKRGGTCSQFMLPVLVGLSGLLIATVSNPYLARFDGIWVIFLPLAFINHWLLTRDRVQDRFGGDAFELSGPL